MLASSRDSGVRHEGEDVRGRFEGGRKEKARRFKSLSRKQSVDPEFVLDLYYFGSFSLCCCRKMSALKFLL